jgi:hypothetical protein
MNLPDYLKGKEGKSDDNIQLEQSDEIKGE